MLALHRISKKRRLVLIDTTDLKRIENTPRLSNSHLMLMLIKTISVEGHLAISVGRACDS